jgi:hypothetical protein
VANFSGKIKGALDFAKRKTESGSKMVSERKKIFQDNEIRSYGHCQQRKRQPRIPAAGVVHTIEWIAYDWLIASGFALRLPV